MNRVFIGTMMCAVFYYSVSFVCADEGVKASVEFSVSHDQDIWAGQQLTVNLDLKTTGFSFSNSHFNLPEVDGAFLMQTDTTTIKLTESHNGETWQVVRYPLALYPQRSGKLQIPSIGVRFSTSASFGSEPRSFDFQTESLEITVKLPPGANQGDLIVTTTAFAVDSAWQPDSGAKQAGDAVTLTVNRRAGDTSAMLLPPLPVFKTDGLAAYPQTPEVADKTNRGDLTGERTDSIIWVVEQAGSYSIPGIRFQWWDPETLELKEQIVPGISLDIPPLPAVNQVPGGFLKSSNIYRWVLIVAIFMAVSFLLWSAYKRQPNGQAVETEQSAFASLQIACKNNAKLESYSAIHTWLAYALPPTGPGKHPATLADFAVLCDDSLLSAELLTLQEALVRSNCSWQGSCLLKALLQARHKIRHQQSIQSSHHLAPLNP